MEILIGDILKSVRKNANLTQSQFAKGINLSQSYISKLEKNEISPSIEILDRYAEYFHTDAELFLRFRKPDKSRSLSDRVKDFIFKKMVYDIEKDPIQDDTEL